MNDAVYGAADPATEDRSTRIKELLSAVRQNARRQLPVPSVTGLVVGGDDGELQIATRTGIVGVPTEEIVATIHPIGSRKDIVTCYLADLDRIRSIFPVRPLDRAPVGSEFDVSIAARAAAGSTGTSTAGAGESMTADPIAGVNSDDCEVHYQTDDSLD